MSRVDVVVFANGGHEIFGQLQPGSPSALSSKIEDFLASLQAADIPRKFTGYYDESDASDIVWSSYNEDNPIVFVPKEPEPIEPTGNEELDARLVNSIPDYEPMELAQIPEEQRANYLP